MNLSSFLLKLKGGSGSGNFGHGGRVGKRGGSSSTSFRFKISVDSITTNEDFAIREIKDYMQEIPDHIQKESSIRSLEVFENPEDATERINQLEPGGLEEYEYARGAYNRDTGKAVVSLYYSDDTFLEAPGLSSRMGGAYSGRNFYHEFAHSLENKITSSSWEKAWHEWNYDQDEGFANAFSSYMVSKRVSRLGNTEEMDYFKKTYPETIKVFQAWNL